MRHWLSLLLSIGYVWVIPTNAQPLNAAQLLRINQLYTYFQQQKVLPDRSTGTCPLPVLQRATANGPVSIEYWLAQIPRLQQNGDSLCAFQVLSAILPAAQRHVATHQAWLLTKIQALQYARLTDGVFSAIGQLEQVSQSNKRMLGWALCEKAKVYNYIIQFEEALQAGNEALAIARAENDRQLEVDALTIIGSTSRDIYRQTPSKYLPYLQQASTVAISLNDSTRILNTYRSLAYAHLYDETADIDAVLGYVEKSLPYLNQQHNQLAGYKLVWTVADGLSYFSASHQKAISLYQRLLPVARRLRRATDSRTLYQYLASLAITYKKYGEAAAYLDSAAQLDSPDWEKDYFYQHQAEVQEALGNFPLANQYYQKALAEKERVYLRRNSQSMTQWETQFRTREKEIQIAQQKSWQWWLTGIVGLLLLMVSVTFLAFLRNRQQLRLLARQKAIIEQQGEELQRLDQAKTRFFSNITHEFRTPLTLILSPLETLIDELPQYPVLKTMQANANRLLVFINQLLDLSKLDAGVIKPNLQQKNLAIFMYQQVESFQALAERRQLHLYFSSLPPDVEISFDADKLSKILSNLIGNALKFTPAGGEVRIHIMLDSWPGKPQFDESLLTPMRQLHIHISDTGLGMPPDQLPYIFNRFYQVNDAHTRFVDGSGIGLALVKELVDVLNGEIRVESEVGKGTQFFLTLPVGKTSSKIDKQPESQLEPQATSMEILTVYQDSTNAQFSQHHTIRGEKPVLLVVEDNDDLRTYISDLFAYQCQVSTAINGQEGLKLALELVPDLVITDWMMPGMDGISLCQYLKTDLRTSHVPILMLTAKTATESRLNSLESGADAHIAKPFHPRELVLKVQNWLERQQRLRHRYQQQLAQPSESPPIPEGDSVFMDHIFSLIDQHLNNSLFGVEQLADALGLNRRTLHRKLISLSGLPPTEVIRNHRLRRALPLLKQGTPIADVAFQVGFETPSYFTKCFKEVFGQKPSEVTNVTKLLK